MDTTDKIYMNESGQEVLDPTPLAIPLGYEKPETMEQKIRRLMRVEYERASLAGLHDIETPEDADDFAIEDDPIDPLTPYEEGFMPAEAPTQPMTSDKDFNPNADNLNKETSGENPPGENPEAASA